MNVDGGREGCVKVRESEVFNQLCGGSCAAFGLLFKTPTSTCFVPIACWHDVLKRQPRAYKFHNRLVCLAHDLPFHFLNNYIIALAINQIMSVFGWWDLFICTTSSYILPLPAFSPLLPSGGEKWRPI